MTIKMITSAIAMILLAFLALGPANWQPRTGLGWQIDHFVGYFGFMLMFGLTWRRPLVVGGILIAVAALLEGLQALAPDRSSNFVATLYGAGGVLTAALFVELLIRARMRPPV